MYSIKGKYAAALLMYGYFVHGVNALVDESGRVPQCGPSHGEFAGRSLDWCGIH